jgi:hypothetical protein
LFNVESLEALPDGSVRLTADESRALDGWRLVTRRDGWAKSAVVRPGERVWLDCLGIIGAGAHWYELIGRRGSEILLREQTSFYGIMPETDELVCVRPYPAGKVNDGSASR